MGIKILPVLNVHSGDAASAIASLELCAFLDGKLDSSILLAHDSLFDISAVHDVAQGAFKRVVHMLYSPYEGDRAWPGPQNHAWQSVARRLESEVAFDDDVRKGMAAWLWWEADAVPLRKGWLAAIDASYRKGKQPFAGVSLRDDATAFYLNGVAIYPFTLIDHLSNCAALWTRKYAFDRIAGPAVKRAGYTDLSSLILRYPKPGGGGTAGRLFSVASARSLIDTHPQAVLYHGCTDTSLQSALRGIDLASSVVTPPAEPLPLAFLDHDALSLARPDFTKPALWHISDYMASVPLMKCPARPHNPTMRPNRIIHTVQRWRPNDASIDRRILTAVHSWLRLYTSGNFIPAHTWPPYTRDAHSTLGDARSLPFLRDILKNGLDLAERDDDIILLTNDDSILHPGLGDELFTRLFSQPCLCTGRFTFPTDDHADFTRPFRDRVDDIGRDAFAFRADWLRSNFDHIPDMLMAEAQFDIVLGSLIRLTAGVPVALDTRPTTIHPAELPIGWVQHEDHERGWNCGPTPGQFHNIKVAAEWYRKHDLSHMIDFDYMP